MKTLIALGVLLISQLLNADSIKVHVRHEAHIASSNIELGSIADISAQNIGDETRLSSLILGAAPESGKTVEWTASEISNRLHPYSRILQNVQLKVPDHITIRRVVNVVTREALIKQIEDMLRATLPDSSWEVQLKEAQLPAQLDIPRDGSVQVVPLLERPRGAAQFQILVQSHGHIENRLWYSGRVAYFAQVPTILRQIEAHSHLMDSDIKWQRKEVTYMGDMPATMTEINSAVTKMTLVPGHLLMRSQLEREMALHFGEEVELRAGDDLFQVTSRGVSQQNGYIGDLVRIKTGNNGKILAGTVVTRGVVQVRY